MSCGNNAKLDGIKAKTEELNSLLQGGKDQLGAMQGKLGELKADLGAFKPEIPEVPNLQKSLLDLANETNPLGLVTKINDLKATYGSAVPDLDSKIASLGLDSFPPSIDAAAICAQIPNVEVKSDGTVKAEAKDSAIAEEVPPEPSPEKKTAPVEEVPLDPYEINAFLFDIGKIRTKLAIRKAARRVTQDKKPFSKITYYTMAEAINEAVVKGGSTWEEVKFTDYTLNDLRRFQEEFKAKYPKLEWDFLSFLGEFEKNFNEKRDEDPRFVEIADFQTACTEAVARRLRKLNTGV